jgi:hypothetical protein
LLLVENPGYIFVRETTMEESYKPFHQEEGIIVIQAFIDYLFEEALVSKSPLSMEEDMAPPKRNDTLLLGGMGHMKLVYEVHRTSLIYGGAIRPTSPLDMIICSTSTHSMVFQWVHHHDGGGGGEAHSP